MPIVIRVINGSVVSNRAQLVAPRSIHVKYVKAVQDPKAHIVISSWPIAFFSLCSLKRAKNVTKNTNRMPKLTVETKMVLLFVAQVARNVRMP